MLQWFHHLSAPVLIVPEHAAKFVEITCDCTTALLYSEAGLG